MRTQRPRQFSCPNCPSMFTHRNNLYYHVKFECGQLPRFSCPYCDYRARHSSNTRAHVKRKHPGQRVFAIDVCKADRAWSWRCSITRGVGGLMRRWTLFTGVSDWLLAEKLRLFEENTTLCLSVEFIFYISNVYGGKVVFRVCFFVWFLSSLCGT